MRATQERPERSPGVGGHRPRRRLALALVIDRNFTTWTPGRPAHPRLAASRADPGWRGRCPRPPTGSRPRAHHPDRRRPRVDQRLNRPYRSRSGPRRVDINDNRRSRPTWAACPTTPRQEVEGADPIPCSCKAMAWPTSRPGRAGRYGRARGPSRADSTTSDAIWPARPPRVWPWRRGGRSVGRATEASARSAAAPCSATTSTRSPVPRPSPPVSPAQRRQQCVDGGEHQAQTRTRPGGGISRRPSTSSSGAREPQGDDRHGQHGRHPHRPLTIARSADRRRRPPPRARRCTRAPSRSRKDLFSSYPSPPACSQATRPRRRSWRGGGRAWRDGACSGPRDGGRERGPNISPRGDGVVPAARVRGAPSTARP